MQWMMTGTVSRMAIRPDHRCTVASQAAPAGRRIRAAVASWTHANTTAPVDSQALAYSGLEKPPTSMANPVGWCSLAYTPSRTATAQPPSRETTIGVANWPLAGPAVVCSLVIAEPSSHTGWFWPPRARRGRSRADDGVRAGDERGREARAVEREAAVAEVERRGRELGGPLHGHPDLGAVGQHGPADPGGEPVDLDPGLVDAGRVRGQLGREREGLPGARRDRAE